MTIQTTNNVKIAYAIDESYGHLCKIVGTISQATAENNNYEAATFTVNGTTVTCVTDNIATPTLVVSMLNTAFRTAGVHDRIEAEVSNTNYVKFKMQAGTVLADGDENPLASLLGIPVGNYPNRSFAGNVITTTVDLSGGHDWSGGGNETLIINGTTYTLTTNCANLTAVKDELADKLAAVTSLSFAVSGTQYIAITLTDNVAIEGGTALNTIGITGGFYAYWTALSVPNSVKLGFLEYDRERRHPAGQSANYTHMITKGIRYKDMELKTYIQNATWMTEAIRDTLYNYCFHVEIPAQNGAYTYADIDGCKMNKYLLEAGKDDCFETTTWTYYGTTTTAAYTSLPSFPFSTATKQFPNATCTIGSTLLDSVMETFSVEITNTLFDHTGCGKYLRSDSTLMTRDVTLKIEGYDDLANAIVLLETLTPTNVDIYAGFGTGYNIKVTEMYPEESNKGDIPAQLEAYKHTYSLQNSGNSVYSIT